MINEHDFSDKQRELYETMSDISEDCCCAGYDAAAFKGYTVLEEPSPAL